MSPLSSVLHPIPLDDLKEHYRKGQCLVIEGAADKFQHLISLQDVERRLNDGCNANVFAQLIKDGTRAADTDANCLWAPSSLRKTAFRQGLEAGHSFMLSNSSQITPEIASLIDDIEAVFADDSVHADVHLYVSTSTRGGSYNAHRDLPQHKILLQAFGETQWQLFEGKEEIPENMIAVLPQEQDHYLKQVAEFTLKQGDFLYMPPGTFHRVVSVGKPRISISIPFYAMPEAQRMDRSYIPFVELFESAD